MDLRAKLQAEIPVFARYLDITVTDASTECVIAELMVRAELCTTSDTIHGGAIMTFADTLGALGTVANLREGQWTTTLESKTNFFGPAPSGTKLIGEATPLHRGRRTQVWETRLSNASGKLVAKVTQTQMVLSA